MLGLLARRADERSSNGAMDKTGRAVISGSRLFNIGFGLPRNEENITRSLGTFQSGSPPGEATIDRRGTEEPRFSIRQLPGSCQTRLNYLSASRLDLSLARARDLPTFICIV